MQSALRVSGTCIHCLFATVRPKFSPVTGMLTSWRANQLRSVYEVSVKCVSPWLTCMQPFLFLPDWKETNRSSAGTTTVCWSWPPSAPCATTPRWITMRSFTNMRTKIQNFAKLFPLFFTSQLQTFMLFILVFPNPHPPGTLPCMFSIFPLLRWLLIDRLFPNCNHLNSVCLKQRSI